MGTECPGDGMWCSVLRCQHGSEGLAVPVSQALVLSPSPLRGQARAGVGEKGSVTPRIK